MLRGFIIPPAAKDAAASASVTKKTGWAQVMLVVKTNHRARGRSFLMWVLMAV